MHEAKLNMDLRNGAFKAMAPKSHYSFSQGPGTSKQGRTQYTSVKGFIWRLFLS